MISVNSRKILSLCELYFAFIVTIGMAVMFIIGCLFLNYDLAVYYSESTHQCMNLNADCVLQQNYNIQVNITLYNNIGHNVNSDYYNIDFNNIMLCNDYIVSNNIIGLRYECYQYNNLLYIYKQKIINYSTTVGAGVIMVTFSICYFVIGHRMLIRSIDDYNRIY